MQTMVLMYQLGETQPLSMQKTVPMDLFHPKLDSYQCHGWLQWISWIETPPLSMQRMVVMDQLDRSTTGIAAKAGWFQHSNFKHDTKHENKCELCVMCVCD
eukprot:915632_1